MAGLNSMRVFFALPVQKELQLSLDQWRTKSMPPCPQKVPMANFHITLAFISAIRESELENLYARANKLLTSNSFNAGSLQLNETGFWPKPGILWLGPNEWPENLTKLAHKLQNIGQAFGAKKDKKAYRPHLTLSRKIESPSYPTIEPDFILNYDCITLYHSISMKQGVKYKEIYSWPLSIGGH